MLSSACAVGGFNTVSHFFGILSGTKRRRIDIAKLKRNHEIELSNNQQTINCLTQLLSEMPEKQTMEIDLLN